MKLSGVIKINDRKIEHCDNFLMELSKLKNDPKMDGVTGIITVDFNNNKKAQWYRFKYYYGYIIPPLADKSFSGNTRKAHIEMKRMFAYHPIQDFDDIPDAHMSGAIIECIEEHHEDGQVIRKSAGYCQGMRSMNNEEMKDFILKVESWYFEFLEGHIENDGIGYRQKAIE